MSFPDPISGRFIVDSLGNNWLGYPAQDTDVLRDFWEFSTGHTNVTNIDNYENTLSNGKARNWSYLF